MEPHIEVCVFPGVPEPVGNLGTIVIERVLPDGRAVLRFTLSHHLARQMFRRGKGQKFDNGRPKT